jgi:hypothetical protein
MVATTDVVGIDFGTDGGGEGGHYFTTNMARVWRHMPQIILQFPYGGMNFRQDPNMVLPPRED